MVTLDAPTMAVTPTAQLLYHRNREPLGCTTDEMSPEGIRMRKVAPDGE
jgi:hypothetical protein